MRPSRGFVLLTVLVFAGHLLAGSLEVIVKDDKGRPGSDAVAYASGAGTASAALKKHAVVDQRGLSGGRSALTASQDSREEQCF